MFYSSIRCVFETAFISEQIAENWFGALLEISDKFISSGFMIMKFRRKSVWRISEPYCMTLQIVTG